MDEIKILPIWVFDFLFCNVFPYALEYLSGIRRNTWVKPDSEAALDIQATVALGISRNAVFTGSGTVCLRILQRDAYLNSPGVCYDDFIQTPLLVRVLPHGNNDAADLQGEKYGAVENTKEGKM